MQCLFVLFFGVHIILGALVGLAFSSETKHLSSQLRGYALSIFVALLVAAFLWWMGRRGVIEEARKRQASP